MRAIQFISMGIAMAVFTSCADSSSQYDASGTFEATEIIVSSEINGKIRELNLEEGTTLRKDQLVGSIDSMQLFLRKKQLQQNIEALKSRQPETHKQIAVIEQQISTYKKEQQRVSALVRANAANQKQLDDITAQLAVLEKQLVAQKSTLSLTTKGIHEDAASLEIQIEQLNDQLMKCRIVNPIDGTVLVKYAEAHELAMPGKTLYKIADLENMIFRAYITSDLLTKLKIGQDVKVVADFGEDTREYNGKVEWISGKSEFTPKTIHTRDERANLVYAVKIAVENDGFLKIGMYGEVDLQLQH